MCSLISGRCQRKPKYAAIETMINSKLCVSTSKIHYHICQGMCSPSGSEMIPLIYTNVDENRPELQFNKDCKCCSGIYVLKHLQASRQECVIENYFSYSSTQTCCGYLKEPSQGDSSFEHPKHMFKLMDKKIISILRSKICLIESKTLFLTFFCALCIPSFQKV